MSRLPSPEDATIVGEASEASSIGTRSRHDRRRSVGDPASPASLTILLCLGYGLCNAGSTTQAVWVAALLRSHRLGAPATGSLASLELILIAGAALSTATGWTSRVGSRLVVVAGGIMIIGANLLAAMPPIWALVAGRLLSGVAMGCVLGVMTAIAARKVAAQRLLTLMQGTVLLIAVVVFACAPFLSADGPGGVYRVLAVLGAAVVIAALWTPPAWFAADPIRSQRLDARQSFHSGAVFVCLGLLAISAGTSSIGTYLLVIGSGLGFGTATVARLLAIAFPCALAGPVLAHFLGERFGALIPLVCALALAAVDVVVLVHAPDLAWFAITTVSLCTLIMFYPPYGLALVGRAGGSKDAAGAAIAAMSFGQAMGPKLGAQFAGNQQFGHLGETSAALVASGIALLLVSQGRRLSGACGGKAGEAPEKRPVLFGARSDDI